VPDRFKKCAVNQPIGHHDPDGGDGDPDLSLHCILGRAEEPFDAKMLFEANQ